MCLVRVLFFLFPKLSSNNNRWCFKKRKFPSISRLIERFLTKLVISYNSRFVCSVRFITALLNLVLFLVISSATFAASDRWAGKNFTVWYYVFAFQLFDETELSVRACSKPIGFNSVWAQSSIECSSFVMHRFDVPAFNQPSCEFDSLLHWFEIVYKLLHDTKSLILMITSMYDSSWREDSSSGLAVTLVRWTNSDDPIRWRVAVVFEINVPKSNFVRKFKWGSKEK